MSKTTRLQTNLLGRRCAPLSDFHLKGWPPTAEGNRKTHFDRKISDLAFREATIVAVSVAKDDDLKVAVEFPDGTVLETWMACLRLVPEVTVATGPVAGRTYRKPAKDCTCGFGPLARDVTHGSDCPVYKRES